MLRITHIGGVRVVEQDTAYGPHPRWPEQEVAYSGIAYVLLENGESGFACEVCGYMREKIRSVATHLRVHNGKDPEPLYPVDTLKTLIRVVKRLKPQYKDYMARAAAELNRRGVESIDKQPWNALRVGRLYARWEPEIKVSVPPTTQPSVPAQREPERKPEPVRASADDAVISRLLRLGEKLVDLSSEFESVASEVASVIGAQVPAIDPAELEVLREKAANWDAVGAEVIEKARKFDAAQSLFGGSQS